MLLPNSLLFQSTHPRGVRRGIGYVPRYYDWFQSTHPRGVRHIYLDFKDYLEKFQSTHPRGVRQKSLGITLGNNGFNPRTHEGCDVD